MREDGFEGKQPKEPGCDDAEGLERQEGGCRGEGDVGELRED
jgi:hypothetical protein